jgi:hypothetical protein
MRVARPLPLVRPCIRIQRNVRNRAVRLERSRFNEDRIPRPACLSLELLAEKSGGPNIHYKCRSLRVAWSN